MSLNSCCGPLTVPWRAFAASASLIIVLPFPAAALLPQLEAVAELGVQNDHALRGRTMKVPWLGKTTIGARGFRFPRTDNADKGIPLELSEVRAILQLRDVPYRGSFRSSEERLDRIWQARAYTVHLNMQDYLWDGIKRDRELKGAVDDCGFGDWLSLDKVKTPIPCIDLAYHAYCAKLMAEMATAIGQPGDAQKHRKRHEEVTNAFRKHYLQADGKLAIHNQTVYAMALFFGLIPKEFQTASAGHPGALARTNGTATNRPPDFPAPGDCCQCSPPTAASAAPGNSMMADLPVQQRFRPTSPPMLDCQAREQSPITARPSPAATA